MKCVCEVKYNLFYNIDGTLYKTVDTEEEAIEIVKKFRNNPNAICELYYTPKFTILEKIG